MSTMFARRIARKSAEAQEDVFAPVADLMVGVVFIFIVIMIALVLNQADEATVPKSEYDQKVAEVARLQERMRQLEEENRRLRGELEQERQAHARVQRERDLLADFAAFIRNQGILGLLDRLSKSDRTREQLLAEMQERLSAAGVNVTVDAQAGTLQLPSRNLFDVSAATPTSQGARTIEQVGEVMASVLPCYLGSQQPRPSCRVASNESALSAVYIEGHTDNLPFTLPTGRFRNNWDLSAGRAIEAFNMLRDRFPVLRDLRNAQGEALLGVSGYADTRAAVREATDAQRSTPDMRDKDRRIEIRAIMGTNQEAVRILLDDLNRRLGIIDALIR